MNLQGKTVGVLVEQKYEDLELWYPALRLKDAGAAVWLIGAKSGESYPSKRGLEAQTDHAVDDVAADQLDALVVPGGFSPDYMRRHPGFKKLVKAVADAGKPVAAICHGPWMLCSARALDGKRATSFHSLRDDLENAGATWVDEQVVVDGNIITSRNPGDLIPFTRAVMEAL